MTWNLNQRSAIAQKQEILGLDFGASGIKAVRLRRQRDQIHLMAAGILPAVDLADEAVRSKPPLLPEALRCSYAAVCINDKRAALRILTLSGTGNLESQIREQLGAGPDMRCIHTPLSTKPLRLLAATMPQSIVDNGLFMFRSGPPAICDLEISGMATLTTCLHALGKDADNAALCVMDVGAQSTYVFFVYQKNMVLVRKYEIGSEVLLTRVSEDLGVDRPTAISVLREGAIDLSPLFREVMEPTIRQVVISRDFVERQEKCRIGKIYCSGALSASPFCRQALRDTSGMEVECWNPFTGLVIEPGALADEYHGMEPRFSAALGAALGVMTASS